MTSILIIEDTPMQIRILDKILSPVYDLKVATTGKKGIDLAHKQPIDLILLDILLEDMSGFEVLEALKRSDRTCDIPVIFITSMDTAEDEVKGLSAGAVDYITKPFIEEIVRLRVDLHMQLLIQMRTIELIGLYDSLTEIRNRHSFNLTMKEEWERAAEKGDCISMIMLDIDMFKRFNDRYGHLCGDVALKTVADGLKTVVDENFVFRWGGEEFVILLPGRMLDSAQVLAEEIRQVIEATRIVFEEGVYANVTISLGVGTVYPNKSNKPENFCTEVDMALYRAKENGRNRVETV